MPRGKDRWAKVLQRVQKQHPGWSDEHCERITSRMLRKEGADPRSHRTYKRKPRK